MKLLEQLPSQARVILTNLLTYLILAQTALTWVIANGLLEAWPEYAQYAVTGVTWLGAVILFIRRVTPVEKHERGILPQS